MAEEEEMAEEEGEEKRGGIVRGRENEVVLIG